MARYQLATFTVDATDMKKLGKIADERRQNKSAMLRLLVHEFLLKERRRVAQPS
jgi:hypothetical protein